MTFQANGKTWKSDKETVEMMNQFRKDGNDYMLGAVFEIGREMGRIVEVVA